MFIVTEYAALNMRSTFKFVTFQNRKNIKIWHFKNVAFMVYIIIKA